MRLQTPPTARHAHRGRASSPVEPDQASESWFLHVHARRRCNHNLLLIQSCERQPELEWIAERHSNAALSGSSWSSIGQLDWRLDTEIRAASRGARNRSSAGCARV